MAVITEESSLSGSVVQANKNGDNRVSRRPRSDSTSSTSTGHLSDSASSQEPSPDGSNNTRHRRRRRRGVKKSKKAKCKPQQPEEPQMTLEEQSQYVAMDCEMVGVGEKGFKSAVARVTVVDWNGQVLLDEFIRPDRQVMDYRSFVSGITASDLDNAGDLESCRQKVLQILHGKVLVGHALKNDLMALNIRHPWYMTRDTAKYEPFMKVRFDDGILWPRKLKDLCQEKLQKEIQQPGQPHSPYEDAVAALDLYKNVRRKWEKVMDYKVSKTKEIEQMKQQQQIVAAQ